MLRGWRKVGAALLVGAIAAPALLPGLPVAQTDTPVTEAPAPEPAVPAEAAPDELVPPPVLPPVEAVPVEAVPAEPTPAPEPASPDLAQHERAALSEVEASLSLSEERVAALKAEIEAMKGDRDRQNAALIAAAERVKLAEADVAAMEDRLGELIVAELEVRGRLEGAGETISGVLAALERISHNPPPALLVDPADALGSARGAMLISAIVPQLKQKADDLIGDLVQLSDIKAAALEEEAQLKANFQILEEEQLRIATLATARKTSEDRVTATLAAEEAAASELADRAGTLKAQIDQLQQRAAAVAVAAEATAAANSGGDSPALAPETIRLALANNQRVEPAVPFMQARGYLTLPTNGVNVVEYGAGDGFGGISRGLSIATRAEAMVVAPADGWVLYSGNYLNYGQIVILNAGQDYTILLAGLASVSVQVGQFVLMGEPVGMMGSRTIGQTATTGAGASRPTLYVEMRKNNEPLDPTGWWARPETPSSTQSG